MIQICRCLPLLPSYLFKLQAELSPSVFCSIPSSTQGVTHFGETDCPELICLITQHLFIIIHLFPPLTQSCCLFFINNKIATCMKSKTYFSTTSLSSIQITDWRPSWMLSFDLSWRPRWVSELFGLDIKCILPCQFSTWKCSLCLIQASTK